MKHIKTFLVLLAFFGLSIHSATAQTWPPTGMIGDGSENNPWQIATHQHLKALADYVNAGNGNETANNWYKMMNTLNLNSYSNWDPIGNNSTNNNTHRFQGIFNGNGKVVANLTIDRPSQNYVGLFGRTVGATITNLGIASGNVKGLQYVGGLVGEAENNSQITNCYARCDVSGAGGSYYYFGGLAGRLNSSTINGCFATGNVTGHGNVGGLVGENAVNCSIHNSYATGNVTGGNGYYAGGLVGVNSAVTSTNTVTYSYATGKVTCQTDRIGGLIGGTDNGSAIVRNCVAANESVSTTLASGTNINRIQGYGSVTIENCYANEDMVITRAGVPFTPNQGSAYGIGKPIAVFKTETFYTTAGNWNSGAWNYSTIWDICENETFPWLRWQGINCNDTFTDEYSLGITYYDWQTNTGNRNQMVSWEDGWVSAVFIQATDVPFNTRGTGYAYYDGTAWHPSAGRIESERTGFGTIARYGTNGVIICAHNVNQKPVLYKSLRDGSNWEQVNIPNTAASYPSVMTSGPNRDIIHILGSSNGTDGGPLRYYRSTNGGATWDKFEVAIPFLSSTYIDPNRLGTCTAHFMETTKYDDPVIPNRLAFVIADKWCDGQVIYSDDNGETWQRKVFFQHPNPLAPSLGTDIMYYSHCSAAAWDPQGKLHITYEFNGTNEGGGYYPNGGGVAYWNELMPVTDTAYIAALHNSHWVWGADRVGVMPPEFFGYVVPINPATNLPDNNVNVYERDVFLRPGFPHGAYNTGVVAFPSIAIDPNGVIHCVYAGITEFTKYSENDDHFYRIYARSSTDNGQTWSDIEMLTKGVVHAEHECVYPWMSYQTLADGQSYLHLIYQQDDIPGTFVNTWDHGAYPSEYRALKVKLKTRPLITTTQLPDGAINLAYFAQLEATGDTPITWSLESGSLPTGLNLSTAGIISGTPTVANTFNFTVKATNSVGSNTKPLSITVTTSAVAPTITTTTLPDGKIGTAYSAQLEATGTGTIAWSLESGNLPNGLTVFSGGTISGTPTVIGTFNFTVQATNSVGNDIKALAIKIEDGVSILENKIPNITIYPNPTSGELWFGFAHHSKVESGEWRVENIEIFDVFGKMVMSVTSSPSGRLGGANISHLPTGIYFIRIQTENKVVTKKIVKQ